ncbi:PQQ-binding-like beta-propeller repeat protein [Nocardiopsis sp. N85]|uniref:outer membrane protein assembly factor BamB family protein n=1 Tax=Nocardiopsis sp. N85 TaxID=3029400 RepID=UPI00237F218B|nr:PQQ-binding-like beta-propeller repeat protein [Nocardiopsis sp. N85]MDE3722121.1 PQQ-binding-like beta-propeller repeat protein [Nocardiopsis sp. N85]
MPSLFPSPGVRGAAVAAAVLAVSACTVTPGPGEPAPDPAADHLREAGYTPTASAISPDEHLLCTAGAERSPDCEGTGQVRWSLPLEGEYRLTGNLLMHHIDTGAQYHDNFTTFHAVEAGRRGVLYAENALLRMIDADTGRVRWTTDLRQDPDVDFLHSGLRSLHADTDRIVLRYGDGFVQVDAEDGAVSGIAPMPPCTGALAAIDGDQVVLEHCHDHEGSYLALDLATGRTLWEFREGDEADLSGGRLHTPSRVFATEVDEGPTSAVEAGSGWHGPAGLGTIALTGVGVTIEGRGDMAVALACAPDGVPSLEAEPHAPGVRCAEPRLYAVNID